MNVRTYDRLFCFQKQLLFKRLSLFKFYYFVDMGTVVRMPGWCFIRQHFTFASHFRRCSSNLPRSPFTYSLPRSYFYSQLFRNQQGTSCMFNFEMYCRKMLLGSPHSSKYGFLGISRHFWSCFRLRGRCHPDRCRSRSAFNASLCLDLDFFSDIAIFSIHVWFSSHIVTGWLFRVHTYLSL